MSEDKDDKREDEKVIPPDERPEDKQDDEVEGGNFTMREAPTDDKPVPDSKKPPKKPDDDGYEKVCFICHRPESKVDKMIHLPNDIFVCSDCMKDISQKKKEEEKTFGLAREDSLTGLMNREAFTRQCEKFLNERALARSKTALSALLVIELTDFKKINDAYGRAYGDKAIRHTADVMCLFLVLTTR